MSEKARTSSWVNKFYWHSGQRNSHFSQLKNAQKYKISLHSNLIFINIEHTILGIMQFSFYMYSFEEYFNLNAISLFGSQFILWSKYCPVLLRGQWCHAPCIKRHIQNMFFIIEIIFNRSKIENLTHQEIMVLRMTWRYFSRVFKYFHFTEIAELSQRNF